jgi:Helix-hairpin-helix domain
MLAAESNSKAETPLARLAENAALAAALAEYAGLLAQQGADALRVVTYRRAAMVVAASARSIAEMFAARGREGLLVLPGISRALAAALAEMVSVGHWSQLARLRGKSEPERFFQAIPHIGAELARRLADELHLETLEALELAVHDGRLAKVEGVGPRRLERIRTALGERLGQPRLRDLKDRQERPGVGLLLEVDREFRERAAAGTLPTLAAGRAQAEASPPILHARRGKWFFTALYTNTRLAHALGRAKDWVSIYSETDKSPEGQCIVAKETRGPSLGLRVVRGREAECLDLWMREHFGTQRPTAIGASGPKARAPLPRKPQPEVAAAAPAAAEHKEQPLQHEWAAALA